MRLTLPRPARRPAATQRRAPTHYFKAPAPENCAGDVARFFRKVTPASWFANVFRIKAMPNCREAATTAPSVHLHPERPRARIKPLTAMRRMRRLIADKEDTEQVFHIIEALNGDAQRRNLMRFAATKRGQALLAEKPSLPDMLDDHDTLRRLPEGSVGRAYVDFMEREGLTAAGLVADSQKSYGDRPAYNDDLEYYGTRLRDTHDLFHVLTGYGRDALGEAALLGFSYSQNPGRGVIFIAYMGARQIAKVAPRGARIMDVLWEGKRHGRTTSKIVQEDIPALLAEPLDAARRRLGIEKPVLYRRALNIIAGVQGPQTVMQAA